MSGGRWLWWVLLPLATAVVLVATASRLWLFWWPNQLHDETSGREGVPVRVADRWLDDERRERSRDFTVTLVDVRPATFVEGYSGPERVEPPPGTAVWQIVLEFEVDPDVPMGLCRVSVFDQYGHESAASGGDAGDVSLPFTACEPADRKGPLYDGTTNPEFPPRVPTYLLSVFAITAADAVPQRVRLWWEAPDYVEIDVAG
jgi:hypothetical protein